jgi:hypothetical protein
MRPNFRPKWVANADQPAGQPQSFSLFPERPRGVNLTNSNLTLAGGGGGGGGWGSGELLVSEISWEYGALSHQLGRLYTDKKEKNLPHI